MNIKDLQKFGEEDNKHLRERNKTTEKEAILTNALKLSEEVGEVCDEVLKSFSYAREEKMEKKNELSHEIADVIIGSSVLAASLGVDLEKALKEKMKKVRERYR